MRRTALVGDDPLPYGIEANSAALEMVVRFELAQKLVPRRVAFDELFSP